MSTNLEHVSKHLDRENPVAADQASPSPARPELDGVTITDIHIPAGRLMRRLFVLGFAAFPVVIVLAFVYQVGFGIVSELLAMWR